MSPRRKPSKSEIPTLTTIVGTASLELISHPELLSPGEIVVIDAANEIATLDVREVAGRRIHLIPVAETETLQGLAARFGSPSQQRLLTGVPNTSASPGLGQCRNFGGWAICKMFAEGELERRVREGVLPELLRRAGGQLRVIKHCHYNGLAGGMGSLGGRLLVERIQQWCIDELDCPIESEIRLIGSATFSGDGFMRTKENASVGIAEYCHGIQNPIHPKASTQLVLTELFPVGKDKARRDFQVLEQQQALAAGDIVHKQNRDKPNVSVSGPIGGTRLVRCDHSNRLEDEEIARDAATEYGRAINDVRASQADNALVDKCGVLERKKRLRRPSIEGIMEEAILLEPDEVIQWVTMPGYRHDPIPYLQLKRGNSPLKLDNIKHTFSVPVTSTQQAAHRLQLLRTCKSSCERELQERSLLREELTDELEDLEFVAQKRLKQLRRVWFTLQSEESRIVRAEAALVEVRETSDAMHQLLAEMESLEDSIEQLSDEEQWFLSPLTRLSGHLDRIAASGGSKGTANVEVAPIDTFYEELMGLAECPTTGIGDVVQLLSRTTAVCTVRGLARILGSEVSVDGICRAVLDGEHLAYRCPPWGGADNPQVPERHVVFPPVEEKTESQLRRQFQRIGGPPIAFAKTALGSVNVVIVEVVHARDVDEVLTPYYRSGIKRATESVLAELFVDNRDALNLNGRTKIEG